MGQIRAAKVLPAPEAYRPGPGDPLQRLVRRVRGEDVDAWEQKSAPADSGGAPGQPAPAGAEAQLGREVLAILRGAPLPGPARAAAAEVLSAQLAERDPHPDLLTHALRRVLGILVTGQRE